MKTQLGLLIVCVALLGSLSTLAQRHIRPVDRAIQVVRRHVPPRSHRSIGEYTDHMVKIGQGNGVNTRNLWSAVASGKHWRVTLGTEINGDVSDMNKATWTVDRNFKTSSPSNDLARGIEFDMATSDL